MSAIHRHEPELFAFSQGREEPLETAGPEAEHSPDNGERVLMIHGWHTECDHCGYGRGGWSGGPAREGKEPLGPDSRVCHGCGCSFTHSVNVSTGQKLTLRKADAA